MMEFERTFDRAANDYDLVRPFYPVELYRDLFRYKPLNAQSHVLDTGCRLVGIEPGESMAARCSRRSMPTRSARTTTPRTPWSACGARRR